MTERRDFSAIEVVTRFPKIHAIASREKEHQRCGDNRSVGEIFAALLPIYVRELREFECVYDPIFGGIRCSRVKPGGAARPRPSIAEGGAPDGVQRSPGPDGVTLGPIPPRAVRPED